jgi:hypothetical protein
VTSCFRGWSLATTASTAPPSCERHQRTGHAAPASLADRSHPTPHATAATQNRNAAPAPSCRPPPRRPRAPRRARPRLSVERPRW